MTDSITPIRMYPFHCLEHYNYSELDIFCNCRLCTEWRTRKGEFYALIPPMESLYSGETVLNHSRACKCETCINPDYLKSRTKYLAMVERRNLYCESSWHAMQEPVKLGETYMHWLESIMFDRKEFTDGVMEGRGGYLPLSWWFVLFRYEMRNEAPRFKALLKTVSGLPQAAKSLTAKIVESSGLERLERLDSWVSGFAISASA